MQEQQHDSDRESNRKPYYVSVQAGQILEDPEAAAYELEILANEDDKSRLHELFKELNSMDNWSVLHFNSRPFSPSNDVELNGNSDEIISRIYRLLYECGTEETKQHIESMGII
ncbi:hypothetical protein I6N90_05145 [Paenibacillus sp. GSMTC-2017]|uniref:hypothetical protein n=1 Tax=Paenibacillus sp. GSMTC-2017 TaxID=2794350 RepID=UPI0018D5B56D|nr:hypothetical protein [Paenibacillus sp. GSMTC-2017]MBH5317194.1 hypothetical protein [Paenibacillus sp. GSMTC-2017]